MTDSSGSHSRGSTEFGYGVFPPAQVKFSGLQQRCWDIVDEDWQIDDNGHDSPAKEHTCIRPAKSMTKFSYRIEQFQV